MKIIEAEHYQDMSEKAARFIIEKVNGLSAPVLGLATGGTPLGTYKCLREDHLSHKTAYQHVYTVNLDEYVGLAPYDENSYTFYMKKHLFHHIGIPSSHTYLPNGMAADLTAECERYEALIERLGGVDLQLLGLGLNGHIGFNEPGTPFSSKTHVVELTESTRKANARYFDSLSSVPTKAVTMGISTIMKSKQILLLVSGANKAGILARLLSEEPHEGTPASVLNMHENVVIIADRDALSAVKERSMIF
ncbi:glucosamine-6-phosphate deaminase [Bacillus sonorensis]|uniref:Glucosamine-6-phosphate deaminase n=2 Tax=Bacillus sonorensis TaxID=119858 RepID=M5P1F8_9BACI|nr:MULTISPECIES: glucosamine-6-phosphate deaminase [Bacillus]TWK83670.1 Glucosamine-6-phosphate deaminase 1 [Bacillus paralicheniformis]ASB91528.1 Glucosamine-6-phosphate deaminase [Bacillus sonorensis]EME73891.1 glucosamine-6-phosphate deaminase [Bacillus sonorensis L12]MBG9914823.1 glucosamine-6-phosphate deaminase [Bacillus sonorensis]MCF7615870.1 glucosamine-6-phosphate deaminase [Bacillus sonorensis]